jgi:hypothetical protein
MLSKSWLYREPSLLSTAYSKRLDDHRVRAALGNVSFGSIKGRFTNGWRNMIFGSEDDNSDVTDEHYLQMLKYKPIPRWWFTFILVGAFAMAQATNYAGKSGMPWWCLIVILIIAFVVSNARFGHVSDQVSDIPYPVAL